MFSALLLNASEGALYDDLRAHAGAALGGFSRHPNLFAKRSSGGVPFVWLFDTASVLIYAPLALWVWVLRPGVEPFALG